MGTELNIINSNVLSVDTKNEIDKQIDIIIAKHKNNRYEINTLVFQSVAALTASENYSSELHSQGLLKRFWGDITGKNKEIQGKIDRSFAASQYASQQTLQKLAEQNLMSFELITAVNNKLNASIVQVEEEINKIYGTLVTFFRQTKSDIIQLENRVERLERNVNLLNWQNSIEYQMWDGIEYSELDYVEKIICLIRDFYDITGTNWTTSDLLLLKSAMSSIDISPKSEIQYYDFISRVSNDARLFKKLFGNISTDGIEEYPEYIAISSGIKKNQMLKENEKYLVDNTIEIMESHMCTVKREEVEENLLTLYERKKANIRLDLSVSAYDLIIEMLYNLEQIKEIQYFNSLEGKLKDAETLFSVYDTKKLIPLLNELISSNVIKAKHMMAILYETGCENLKRDDAKCFELFDECIEAGYLPSLVRRLIPLNGEIDREVCIQKIPPVFDELRKLAETDMFAAEECARVYLNPHFIALEKCEESYQKAIQYFERAPVVLGYYGLAMRFHYGQGVEQNYELAYEYLYMAAMMGYNKAIQWIGFYHEKEYSEDSFKSDAAKWYKKAYDFGEHRAITNLAWCYSKDNKEYGVSTDYKKFFELSMEAYELGDMPSWGIGNIGWAYQYGKGVDMDIEKAKLYYKEAADMGDDWSKNKLKELED